MLKFAAAIVVGALAMGAAQAVLALGEARDAPALRASVAVDEPAAGGPASIVKSKDGHYWAEADVNGRRVRFLVDTGATSVALTAADAKRLGFQDHELDFRMPVVTANGEARGAKVQLASVSVAGARVEKVDAVVIDHGLPTSLLGMSYLGRLSRIEATPQTLVLRP